VTPEQACREIGHALVCQAEKDGVKPSPRLEIRLLAMAVAFMGPAIAVLLW